MKFGLKDFVFFGVLVLLFVMVILWGYQKHRVEEIEQQKMGEQTIHAQEKVERQYIPERLDLKTGDELSSMGSKLWGE